MLLLTSWCVWKERNNRTFQRKSASLQALHLAVLTEAEVWITAGFKSLNVVLVAWSQKLLPM